MPCLSREQLEQIADGVIHQYKAALVPEKHLCYNVDPTELASLLGYTVDYQYLTKDGSVLGKTASGKMWITVYDSDKTEILYELDDRTILIEKRLLFSPRNVGRKNFTIAHELAHQIINRSFCQALQSSIIGMISKLHPYFDRFRCILSQAVLS